jgi:putative hydrolase of the HAD superfamily
MQKIKLITFDLDDTFWDIGPVIINAELSTRKWLEKRWVK